MGRTVPWRPNAAKPWSVGNARRPCAPPRCWRRPSGRSPCPSSRSSGRNHGGRSARRPEGPGWLGLVGWKVRGGLVQLTVNYPNHFLPYFIWESYNDVDIFNIPKRSQCMQTELPGKVSKRILHQHNPLRYSPDPEPNSLGKEFLREAFGAMRWWDWEPSLQPKKPPGFHDFPLLWFSLPIWWDERYMYLHEWLIFIRCM